MSRNVENKNAKSKQFTYEFSRFSPIMFVDDFGGVRIEILHHFGGPEADFEDFDDLCDSGHAPATKGYLDLEVILQPKPDFLSVVFLMFF